jgi:hypothetical protein
MKESQKNSVRNLEYLYSTVVGLGLSLAIYNLIDTTREAVPFKLELLPFFFTLLITLIPFYHGALRHLDVTYVEEGGKQVRKFALLIDFSALFIESCLLLALAVLMVKPPFFAWGLVALLAFDTIWAFSAHLGFSQDVKPKAELRWTIINLITVIILSVYLVVFDFIPPLTYVSDAKIWVGILGISILRTVIDYWLCWDIYYPSSSD